MNDITDKSVLAFQRLFKERYGVEYTLDEPSEAFRNLVGYFDVLIEMDRENK